MKVQKLNHVTVYSKECDLFWETAANIGTTTVDGLDGWGLGSYPLLPELVLYIVKK